MIGSATPRRRVPLAALVALAVLGGLVLGVGIDVARSGGVGPWLARRGLPPPYIPQGERFDVGGGRMLYLDCRGEGAPTIVLEAGSGTDSATWSAVHDPLAATTRTCAYDRAGRGRSDSRDVHTLADAGTDLRALLEVAGESGPFIVAGHSLGGAYARVFASTYRGEVTAVVLIDAFDPDLQDDFIHPLLGPLRAEYERGLDGLRAHVSRVDALDWTASEAQLRASSIDGLPLMAIVAPRREPRLDAPTNEAIRLAWIAAYESLSPGHLEHIVAWGAGHNVQIDRPDLVVESIRRLVGTAILP